MVIPDHIVNINLNVFAADLITSHLIVPTHVIFLRNVYYVQVITQPTKKAAQSKKTSNYEKDTPQ
jgi:hypothetical protein